MTRTFGIELETVPAAGLEVGYNGRLVRDMRAAGLGAIENTHFGSDYTTWQVKPDSSVSILRGGRRFYGAEVVSPVLPATAAGFAEVERVCSIIGAAGATSNRSCGMHVHVDIRDLSVEQVRNVVKAYALMQDEIDGVLPRSRRNCRWARPLCSGYSREWFAQRIDNVATVEGIAALVGTRYTVLNLQKFATLGTIEFRQHSGTAEASKALPWARWCVAFVDTFKDATLSAAAPAAPVASVEVLKAYEPKGSPRGCRKGCSGLLLAAVRQGATTAQLQVIIDAHGSILSVCWWMSQLAYKNGQPVILARTATGDVWMLDQGAVAPADPFERCFGITGEVSYFGRRRRQFAR